ncbi:MAG: hypothetical protein JRI23_07965, partial [Deltaproteobacteria bacterium]|nr:hypothetical protein [Deltaproteobacteria bacterium]MBW2531542.1 hypothetical protein [Deltaproteobacteria bacterium]
MIRRVLGLVVGCSAAGALVITACGDDDESGPGPSGADCYPDLAGCPALSTDCLALEDYSGQSQFTLRLSQLSVTRPAVLVQEVMYNIIGQGVHINLEQCNVSGQGTFAWLMHFDTDAGTLMTGGAIPKPDPTDGFCFQYDPANDIAPITVAAPLGGDGSFSAGPIDSLTVPIYLDMQLSDMVKLPLHDVSFTGRVSADHNCIGRYNGDGLEPVNNCKPDLDEGIEYFVNEATLDGYISLEEADTVVVDVLDQSLCVVLSGSPNTYGEGDNPMRCKRTDGAIDFVGDWCAATNSEGGCQDAVRLSGNLAASAVPLQSSCPAGT